MSEQDYADGYQRGYDVAYSRALSRQAARLPLTLGAGDDSRSVEWYERAVKALQETSEAEFA